MILKREIIAELSKELSLPFTGIEQDWDVEMADLNRIDYFLKFYQGNELSVDKKVALISLIIASYEEFLNENNIHVDGRWDEIKSILESERVIFTNLIDYWSLRNEVAENNLFRVTPIMRNVK